MGAALARVLLLREECRGVWEGLYDHNLRDQLKVKKRLAKK